MKLSEKLHEKDTKETLLAIKSKIEHEDNLRNTRVNWLILIQGGLALTYLGNQEKLDQYKYFIIFLGLISSVYIFSNILLGEICIKKIRRKFETEFHDLDKEDKYLIIGYIIEKHDETIYWIKKLISSTYLIAVSIVVFWIWMFISTVFNPQDKNITSLNQISKSIIIIDKNPIIIKSSTNNSTIIKSLGLDSILLTIKQ